MRSASVDAELKERKIIISAILQKRQDERAKQMFGMSSGTIDEERREMMEQLDGVFTTLAGTLGEARMRRLKLSEGRWLGYYGMLLNGRYQPIIHTNIAEPIAFNMPQEDVLFQGKRGKLVTGDDQERSIRVYSLKNYPMASFPGIFDGLDLPVDVVISQSFLPISRA